MAVADQETWVWGPTAGLVLFCIGLVLLWGGESFFRQRGFLLDYYEAIVVAVGLALAIRALVIEPFKIPSGSMIPTLLVGDYLFVNKLAYGHRVPFTRYRAFMSEGPKRGDIVVFEYPRDPGKDYIKRVVGLPGDHLVYENNRLYVNGELAQYQDQGLYQYRNERGMEIGARLLREKTGDKSHAILVQPLSFSSQRHEEHVPPGNYFVMGDNRDNSNDSRYWGFVPEHRLVGKAVMLFLSWDSQEDWMNRLRWRRIGQWLE
ncbi:MAG: signal peptidase I [Magnetococcales bacterium]|nr:signal peptidase I [Magnetococcales bacterium]